MDTYTELLLEAIAQCDLNLLKYCLQKGAKVNKICSNGFTALGTAARSGNVQFVKLLAESTKKTIDLDLENDNPLITQVMADAQGKSPYKKNIGYFVVCKELEELGDGPTPDGMDALEWDTEISDENNGEELLPTPPEIDIYKWYAKILTRTAVMLKSPENDLARLDRHGQNVLHYAVSIGCVEMIEYLVGNYAEINVNQTNNDWLTPLHLATLAGFPQAVRCLIQNGANVNAPDSARQTALHFAARRSDKETCDLLLESGANVNYYDVEERSSLTVAILNGDEAIARRLVLAGTRLNHEEIYGYTVLHRSVWNNLFETTKLLLESGAKMIRSHYLVHVAVRNENCELVQLLHSAGAVLNVRDEQGNTPLMLACKCRHYAVAKYLLQNGAPANTTNHINGMSALHVCVQEIRDPVVFQQFLEMLISHRANLNLSSCQGSALFYAIILGNLKGAALLVKHGCDVNSQDEHGYVDNLSLAKKHGNLDLVRLMVHAGFEMRNMSFELKSLRTGPEDPVHDYLVEAKTNPLNLREICRIRIRRVLGRNLLAKVPLLPLPTIMFKYLALDVY